MTGPNKPQGDVVVHVFGRTDVGRTREHNEDTFAVADLTTMNASLQPEVRTHVTGSRGTFFMVADGMGGAAAGEVASAMATEVVLAESWYVEMIARASEGDLGACAAADQVLKLHTNRSRREAATLTKTNYCR